MVKSVIKADVNKLCNVIAKNLAFSTNWKLISISWKFSTCSNFSNNWQAINHFFKMFIWILVLWMRGSVVSEAFSEPSRTSKMKFFARIANCFQPFLKDLHIRCSPGFLICLCVFNYFKTITIMVLKTIFW